MSGGAKKFIIKDIHLLIENYIDRVKHATSVSNLQIKLRPILSRNFNYSIEMGNGIKVGRKTDFSSYLYARQTFYEDAKTTVKIIGSKEATVIFKTPQKSVKQIIYLGDNYQIIAIKEVKINSNQNGGIGYTYDVGMNPIAGRPVITPYLNCCKPIFNGQLLQNGGKINADYYLDIADNHLNVLPQYRARGN